MLIAALLLALAVAPREGLPSGAGEPVAGRCHMGECEWFAELARETVREVADGRLVKLRLLAGRSSVREGEDYAEAWGRNARVEWRLEAHERWIFCSPLLPMAIDRVPQGYVVEPLLDPGQARLQTAARLYAHTCGTEIAAVSAPAGPDGPPSEIILSEPEDIFALRWVVTDSRGDGAVQVARRSRRR